MGNCYTTDGYIEPFYWTENDGMTAAISLLNGASSCTATAFSGDGKVVVGNCTVSGNTDGAESCHFTGISERGDNSVGTCIFSSGERPVIWRLGIGFSEMNARVGCTRTRPVAVSADGTIIVGYDNDSVSASLPSEAIIWQQNGSLTSISEIITSLGVEGTDWDLKKTTACTPDGSANVGSGINPDGESEAWIFRFNSQ